MDAGRPRTRSNEGTAHGRTDTAAEADATDASGTDAAAPHRTATEVSVRPRITS